MYARGLGLSTHARGLGLSTHARGLGLSPMLGGLAFRPRLEDFAHARGLGLSTHAQGLCPRSGASPTLGGFAFRPTLGGCALSTYARGLRSPDLRLGVFCPPDLRSGAPPFCPRRIRHMYTIYTQSGGTNIATGLVHGAAAPWFALCRSLSVIIC
jgi:hypothetical protein